MWTDKSELMRITGYIGAILSALAVFYKWSGIPQDIETNFGVAVEGMFWAVTMFLALIGSVRFLFFYELLGAGKKPIGTSSRDKYDGLRSRLVGQQPEGDGFASRLDLLVNQIDSFFGDAVSTKQHAFLLHKPAPLWSTSSFDRCLFLAILYPIGTSFIIWAAIGESGAIGRALGLTDTSYTRRLLSVISIAVLTISTWRATQSRGWRFFTWLISSITSYIVAGANAVSNAVVISVSGALSGTLALMVIFVISTAGVSVVANYVGSLIFIAGTALLLVTVMGFFVSGANSDGPDISAIGLPIILRELTHICMLKIGGVSKYVALITLIGIISIFVIARYASNFPLWRVSEPIILFVCLIPLIEAPFAWIALGITRLMLRCGIQSGGPWPFVYALLDAVSAAGFLILSTLALVGSADIYNHLVVEGGGTTTLPFMHDFIISLRKTPSAPEYLWVYATLFSIMIPSIMNLFIAGFSFTRGLPVLRDFLLSVMRENETMPPASRFAAALILTLQGSFAFIFAVGAQALLAWSVIWHLTPMLGLGVLDLAEKVAM